MNFCPTPSTYGGVFPRPTIIVTKNMTNNIYMSRVPKGVDVRLIFYRKGKAHTKLIKMEYALDPEIDSE